MRHNSLEELYQCIRYNKSTFVLEDTLPRKIQTLVGGLISLVFLGLLLYQIDLTRTWDALLRARYWLLAPAIAVFFVGVWFRAVRWRYLLRPLKDIATARLFPVVVVGYTVNDLLPVRVGEIVRAYMVGDKEHLSKLAIVGTIAAERLLDGLTLLFFAAIATIFLPIEEPLKSLLTGIAGLYIAALAIGFFLCSSASRTEAILGLALRVLPSSIRLRVQEASTLVLHGLSVMSSPRWFGAAALFSMLSWITEGTFFYLVGLAFDIQQPLTVYILAMAAANLATSLPSSQAGIGPFEYFCALVFIQFGTPPDVAAAYTIVVHAALIVPIVLPGLIYLWTKQIGWRDITAISTSPSPAQVGVTITENNNQENM